MPDIGNTLREARIRKGLSLVDVETVTKIRRKYLEALEENDFEVLPGPTVVKGFLRSYAVFLKLDPERILTEYRSQYEYHRDEIGALRTEMAQQRRSPTSAERKKKRTRRTQTGLRHSGRDRRPFGHPAVLARLGPRTASCQHRRGQPAYNRVDRFFHHHRRSDHYRRK